MVFIFKGITQEPLDQVTDLNPGYLGLGFLVLILVWLSKAFRVYTIALGMGQRISLRDSFQIYLATCFVSHVTPFNAGGTPLQIYLLHKKGFSLGTATAVTTIDLGLHSIIYLLILIGTVFLKFGLLQRLGLFDQGLIAKGLAALFFLIIVAGILFLFFRLNWTRKIGLLMAEKGWLKRLKREFLLFKEGSSLLFKNNWPAMFKAVISSIIYWAFYLLLAPIIMLAMGKRVEFFGPIYAQLIFNLVQPLIPTPGGSGGSEVLLSYLFRQLTGVQGLGILVFLWRVYTFYSSLLVGGFYFWKIYRMK